jgi:hypothetical protein
MTITDYGYDNDYDYNYELAESVSMSDIAKAVRALLDAGADVFSSNSDGWQPPHFAAGYLRTAAEAGAIIPHLLHAGADVNEKDAREPSACWWLPAPTSTPKANAASSLCMLQRTLPASCCESPSGTWRRSRGTSPAQPDIVLR